MNSATSPFRRLPGRPAVDLVEAQGPEAPSPTHSAEGLQGAATLKSGQGLAIAEGGPLASSR